MLGSGYIELLCIYFSVIKHLLHISDTPGQLGLQPIHRVKWPGTLPFMSCVNGPQVICVRIVITQLSRIPSRQRSSIFVTDVQMNKPLYATLSISPVWTGLYAVLFVVFQDISTCLTRSWWRFGRRRTIATGAETLRPSSPSPTPTTRRPSCSAPCRTPSVSSPREQQRLTSSNPAPTPRTTTPYF